MNTKIQPFEFEHNQIRAFADGDEVMFVASDIAKTLGYGSTKDMARKLNSYEKGKRQVPTPRGYMQNMTVITDAGLYHAILNRELGYLDGKQEEFVKRFQRWVTYEVLPSICKRGARTLQSTPANTLPNPSTTLDTFNFENNTVRIIQDEHGNPLFCANDVAKVLGYARPADAITAHCKGSANYRPLETPGGIQRVRFITEGDMYRLIASSKLPAAERFERWTYDTVLPSIRKTGGYIPATEADSDEDILAKAVLIAQKTIDLKNRQLQAKDARIKELEPKAKALDDFTNVPDTLLVRDAAKLLSNAGTPIGEKELREWLSRHGWIYRHAGAWSAASERVKAGHLAMVESKSHGRHKDGSIFAYAPTVKITRKGLALLHTRLGETRLNETLKTTNN